MLHLTIMSSYFTMKSTIYPGCDFCPFLRQRPFFTLLWLSLRILDGVSRRTENCTVAQRTPFASQAVINKPQMRHWQHAEDFTPVLYSEDKNSILVSKAKTRKEIYKFFSSKWHSGLCLYISGHKVGVMQNQKETSQTRTDAFRTSPNTPWK